MKRFEHSTTITAPDGRVLLQMLGGGQCADEISDEQLREDIKANLLRELRWDIKISRSR